ncbi:DNA translocase FtsK [uncultured Megasphaera sp.]|uniref:DNA translocase FtsK n=1 Tax=uncultured Megasphaera sp. TaxID=165188 RepID=UPI00259A6304|nr:DNA translocase FtsK [uncultured Megasphaera sp.]
MNFFEDELMKEAISEVLRQQKASTTMLQRRFHIGYNRAHRLIQHMETMGIISGKNGYEARKVIMDKGDVLRRYLR